MDKGNNSPGIDWPTFTLAVTFAYAIFLTALFVEHFWLRDARGAIIAGDFVVFASGAMASLGHAAMAYDWKSLHAAEVAFAGNTFSGNFPLSYPPHFLFVAALLARFPYLVSFFLWIAVTLSLYALVVGRIASFPGAWLAALAFPAVLLNAYVGQNGFLSAALVGGFLLMMKDSPWLSGICLGLLTYKPQFGILFPMVLIASGQWRVLISASVTAFLLVIASIFVFGADTWIAFFHSIPATTIAILEEGRTGWEKLQSIYGLVRWFGGNAATAWWAQAMMLLAIAAALIVLWRRNDISFEVKAAALVSGALAATPYSYIYDFPILALAYAFLFRQRPFDRVEVWAAIAINLIMFVFVWRPLPIGVVLVALPFILIGRRIILGSPPCLPDIALQRA